MKALILARVALLAAGVGILCSCTPDGGTIYATVETETKTVDNSLPNTLTVGDIVRTAANTYYVAAGHLYKGILNTTTNKVAWTSAKTPPANALATALAFDGTSMWGGFITAGAVLGLYSSGPAPFTADFVLVGDPAVKTKQVYALSTFGTDLFVVCAVLSVSTYVFELENYNTVLTTWTGPLLSGLANPIVGVATDGAAFFTASGANIYSAGTATGTYSVVQPLAAGDVATGIVGVSGKVLVTTTTGGVYYHDTSWHHVAAPVLNSAAVPLLSIAGPIDGAGKYLVGSDGFGYFTLDISGTPTFTRFADSAVPLYSTSVRRILVDGSGPSTVLMGTNGSGLWRATFSAAGLLSSDWTHE